MYVQKRNLKAQPKRKEPTRYEMTKFYTLQKLASKHPRWDNETLYGVASLASFFVFLVSFPYGAYKKAVIKRKVRKSGKH